MVDAPLSDAEVPALWSGLGLPGLIDSHVHFLPEGMQAKVWAYFDEASDHYGTDWPVHYRFDPQTRLRRLDELGVLRFPSLPYPHKPGMAQWLNQWSGEFAAAHPQVLRSATFFCEPGAGEYLADAIDAGAVVVKAHVQVGGYDPSDAMLDPVWRVLSDTGVPVVIHCGSAPIPGRHTGAAPVLDVLDRFPGLRMIVAHAGMDEYLPFWELAARREHVYLDTTMVGTRFTERFAPLPPDAAPRLADLAGKVLLGSDFPSIPYPYAEQLAALVRLDLGEDWLRAVLHHNAARLFGLTAGGHG